MTEDLLMSPGKAGGGDPARSMLIFLARDVGAEWGQRRARALDRIMILVIMENAWHTI
jgi:hypothetical protein